MIIPVNDLTPRNTIIEFIASMILELPIDVDHTFTPLYEQSFREMIHGVIDNLAIDPIDSRIRLTWWLQQYAIYHDNITLLQAPPIPPPRIERQDAMMGDDFMMMD